MRLSEAVVGNGLLGYQAVRPVREEDVGFSKADRWTQAREVTL